MIIYTDCMGREKDPAGIRDFSPSPSWWTDHFWALSSLSSVPGGEYLRPWEGCCTDDSGQWHCANVTAQWAFQGQWNGRFWWKSAEWLSKLKVLRKRVLLWCFWGEPSCQTWVKMGDLTLQPKATQRFLTTLQASCRVRVSRGHFSLFEEVAIGVVTLWVRVWISQNDGPRANLVSFQSQSM